MVKSVGVRKTDGAKSGADRADTKTDGAKNKVSDAGSKAGKFDLKFWALVMGLLLAVMGSILFVVAVSGGFDGVSKATVDAEYLCGDDCDGEYMDLTPDEYERLVADKKSFVLLVDQGGCKTADTLKEFMARYASDKGFRVYRMMFEDMKKTSLHDSVKYYPSVAVISNGKVIGYLRADSDEDSDAYNHYGAFETWIQKYLK